MGECCVRMRNVQINISREPLHCISLQSSVRWWNRALAGTWRFSGLWWSSNKSIEAMKRRNHEQGSCPADQPPPSYEEIAGSSQNMQQASVGGKSFPPEYPPSYSGPEQQQVRVVYLPAPDFGPNSVKIVCSSCQVFWIWEKPVSNISVVGNSEHDHFQQAKYDGMGSLLCSLLHHALALLLCSLLCGQFEECETHLSQL